MNQVACNYNKGSHDPQRTSHESRRVVVEEVVENDVQSNKDHDSTKDPESDSESLCCAAHISTLQFVPSLT